MRAYHISLDFITGVSYILKTKFPQILMTSSVVISYTQGHLHVLTLEGGILS